jgi:hypothetical protein
MTLTYSEASDRRIPAQANKEMEECMFRHRYKKIMPEKGNIA